MATPDKTIVLRFSGSILMSKEALQKWQDEANEATHGAVDLTDYLDYHIDRAIKGIDPHSESLRSFFRIIHIKEEPDGKNPTTHE